MTSWDEWKSNLNILYQTSKEVYSPYTLSGFKGVEKIEVTTEDVVAFPLTATAKVWLAEINGTDKTYDFSRNILPSENIWGKDYSGSKISKSRVQEKKWTIFPDVIYEIGGPKQKGKEIREFFIISEEEIHLIKPRAIIELFDEIEDKEPIIPAIEGKRLSEIPENLRSYQKFI